jgi:hypothetical protein
LKGQLAFVNSSDWPHRTTQEVKHDLFAPRVGFAFRATNSTVIRAGYGISYLPIDLAGGSPSSSPINSASTSYVAAGNNPNIPLNTLSIPFPSGGVAGTIQQSILQPTGRNYNLSGLEGLNISGPIVDEPYGYVQQWNFGFQHELKPGLLFDIGYAGLKGTHLPAGNLQLNQLSSSYYSQGAALLNLVTNPMAGKLNPTATAYNGTTIRQGQLYRPYPQFGNVQDASGRVGISSFHSMQIRLEKRFGSAGIVTGNYTWSKSMGNVDTSIAILQKMTIGSFQDYNNIRGEYSLTSFDVPHRVIGSYVLELPVGKGKKFAAGATGLVGGLISGWSVNGIVNFQSGWPLSLQAQGNTLSTTFGAGTIRPNRVAGCDPVISGPAQSRYNKWFNTACFSQPGSYSLGNESRTDPNLRAHGVNNIDFTLSKMTTITERVKLQFKTEFFNLFNRVQFSLQNATTLGTAQFGVSSAQLNQPRLIQFALRLVF